MQVILVFLLLVTSAAVSADVPHDLVRKASEVKDRHANSLMRLPAVSAVGVGESARQPGRAAILIYVNRKLKPKEQQRFPKELDGAPVEIRQGGPFIAAPKRKS